MEDFALDINAYLARMGAERPRELSPESLQRLVRAHLEHIPFEDLELTEEKARQLRARMAQTESFHDAMYHSAIASRLARSA